MASSSRKISRLPLPSKDSFPRVICLLRRKWVAATPEEVVRQRLLHQMVEELYFPRSLLSVETAAAFRRGARRCDLLAYTPDRLLGLAPLLLVECKASSLRETALIQLAGYNRTVRASFLLLKGPDEEQLFVARGGEISLLSHRLLSYRELVEFLRSE